MRAGLRYEYQKTDYYEKDVLQAEQFRLQGLDSICIHQATARII